MKKILMIGFLAAGLTACNNSNQTAATNQAAPQNANAATTTTTQQRDADSLVVSSHSTSPKAPDSGGQGGNAAAQKPSAAVNQTEGPMAKPVDVSAQTAAIEKAEKEYKQKSSDAKAKETLAEAYFARAFILTDAAQYRAALGDFRKGLKLKPDHADAKNMHDRIIAIFQGLKREPPKEGEEPPPLPVQKG
jgi:tetratricopeptide (TPR) repeat protein